MDEYGCDYECRTVGESIDKYKIPDDWCVEFDIWDEICPTIVIQAAQIRSSPGMMGLKLRLIEDPDDELAGCMILPKRRSIAFKINGMDDLIKAMYPGIRE